MDDVIAGASIRGTASVQVSRYDTEKVREEEERYYYNWWNWLHSKLSSLTIFFNYGGEWTCQLPNDGQQIVSWINT